MIAIEVYRGSGTHRGDDIIDPLIGSDVCAIARGRNELDARAHQRSKVRMVILHRPNLRLGQLVRTTDLAGVHWTGMITGIAHDLSGGKALTTLTLDRPEV